MGIAKNKRGEKLKKKKKKTIETSIGTKWLPEAVICRTTKKVLWGSASTTAPGPQKNRKSQKMPHKVTGPS